MKDWKVKKEFEGKTCLIPSVGVVVLTDELPDSVAKFASEELKLDFFEKVEAVTESPKATAKGVAAVPAQNPVNATSNA